MKNLEQNKKNLDPKSGTPARFSWVGRPTQLFFEKHKKRPCFESGIAKKRKLRRENLAKKRKKTRKIEFRQAPIRKIDRAKNH
jgi:hypothetical protein